ncbi:MAG: hypothetical protein KGQ28_06975, partial [Hyphomicrobiales bacterium]|nr:hypothetical protein [Hyphomicrobiales bacterium]
MPADAGSHGETPGRAAWDALAASALNGGDIKSLESASADGVPLGPIFERVTVDRPRAWRAAMRWETCERIDEPDPARASDDLRAAAAGGADAVEIVLVGAPRAYGLGVSLDSATDARTTIAAVDAARGPAIALSTG